MSRFIACAVTALCCCMPFASFYAQNNTTLPLTEKLLGSNYRRTDDWRKTKSVGFVREYHDWALDIGYAPSGTPNCATGAGKIRLNPSFDGASSTNFDDLYGQFGGEICPVLYGGSPYKLGFTSYPGLEALEGKPVCADQYNDQFTDPLTISSQLAAYRDYVQWATLYAARYGASQKWKENAAFSAFFENTMHNQEMHPGNLGQNKVHYLEIWNEQDKNWRQPMNQFRFTAPQYAALLSAAFDGHNQDVSMQVTGVDGYPSLGIHQVDSTMKVVFGGLSAFRGCFVEGVIDWCRTHRGTNARLPFDVVNFHHYNNTYFEIPQKTPEYVWNHICPDVNSQELQLGTAGVCPERAGMRERLQYSIQKLVDYDSEMAEKEFWLSETGYDVTDGSPQVAKVPGISNHEAQGQWLVRTFLEASAAVITLPDGRKKGYDKVLLYDVRDTNTGASWLFATSGLFTDIPHGFVPKLSWYYLQSYRNALKLHRFQADLSSANNQQNAGKIARVYEFRDTTGHFTLAAWSPTQTNQHISDYKITLPAGDIPGDSVFVTALREGSETGDVFSLSVQLDATTGQRYVLFSGNNKLSETPVFITNSLVPIRNIPCPVLSVDAVWCNGIQIRTNYPAGVQYDKTVKVYYAEGNVSFSLANVMLYSSTVAHKNNYIYVGGLTPGKTYRIWVVPSSQGQIPATPCYVEVFIPYNAPGGDIAVTPEMIEDGCGGGALPAWASGWKMFDESSISSCNRSTPSSPWQCPNTSGCSTCIVFPEPRTVDAVYFYLHAGLGTLKFTYTDIWGNTGVINDDFRVITGMHGRWYHFANFANGRLLQKVTVEVMNDLQIGEMRIFSHPICQDMPVGAPVTPQWANAGLEYNCEKAAISWTIPGGLPADFDYCRVQVNNQLLPPFKAGDAGADGVFHTIFPIAENEEYNVKIWAVDCKGNVSDTLSGYVQTPDCGCVPMPVFSYDSLTCSRIELQHIIPATGCRELLDVQVYRFNAGNCVAGASPSDYDFSFQLPVGAANFVIPDSTGHLNVALEANQQYHFYLKSTYAGGFTYLQEIGVCSPVCPTQPPGESNCDCKPLDLTPFTVEVLSPALPGNYQMLGDMCADSWTHGPEAIKDEQNKFLTAAELICEDLYPADIPDFTDCSTSNLTAALSEWFPGWNPEVYPATLRIDLGDLKQVNKVYLFDSNSSGMVKIRTEDENGIVSDWGESNLSNWRKWVPVIEDTDGRKIRALHIVRMSAGARFAEIGICGNEETGERTGEYSKSTLLPAHDWHLWSNLIRKGDVLKVSVPDQVQELMITDALGRVVARDRATTLIDTNGLSAGIYFVQPRAINGSSLAAQKMVVF